MGREVTELRRAAPERSRPYARLSLAVLVGVARVRTALRRVPRYGGDTMALIHNGWPTDGEAGNAEALHVASP